MPAKCRLDGLTVGPVNAPYGPSVNAAVQPVSPPFKQQTPVHPLEEEERITVSIMDTIT